MPDERSLLSGPVEVMLSRAQDEIPTATALSGGTVWEPKWDGYRAVLQADTGGGMRLWSRNQTDLSDTFPDVIGAARTQVPGGVVLDGEICVWSAGRLSFDHLQHRMASNPRAVARLALEHPASYVAFDILAVDSTDIGSLPWRDRRSLLEELAASFEPPVQVSPYTEDYATALEWFEAL